MTVKAAHPYIRMFCMRAALLLLFWFFMAGSLAHAQPVKSVRVTGQGTTHFEARQDAVRQALQIAVDQLVLDQRVVRNDKLLLDKISSTMNGFVSNFDTITVSKTEQGFSIEAEIEVSETRITNFIGSLSGARASINSDNILASVNQEKLARQARSEMLLALLSDFPGGALEAAKPSISINQQDPDILTIESAVRVDPTFVSTTKRALETLTDTHWKTFRSYSTRTDGIERIDDPFLVGPGSKIGPYALVCFLKFPFTYPSWSGSDVRDSDPRGECFAVPDIDKSVIVRSLQSRGSLEYPLSTYHYHDADDQNFEFSLAGQFAVLGLSGNKVERLQLIREKDEGFQNTDVSLLAAVIATPSNPNVRIFIYEDWIKTKVSLRAAGVGNMTAVEIVPVPRINHLYLAKKNTMPSLLGKQFVSDGEYLEHYTLETGLRRR